MNQFAKGDRVQFRDDPTEQGIVVGLAREIAGDWYLEVRFDAGTTQEVLVDHLELVDPPLPCRDLLLRGKFRGLRHLQGTLTYEKLAHPRREILYSLRSARTEFHAYQFKPVLKFLESPAAGLLIADEVGLGKTIEAGYILRELQARSPDDFRRALVVCPAALRHKWYEEMTRRFSEPFEIADIRTLRDTARRSERDGDSTQFRLVTSFNTLRSDEGRELLEAIGAIDLTIVDEAHHFRNTGTQTNTLGTKLRELSQHLVLLSATPVQLNSDNLFQLLKLLAPDLFADRNTFAEQFEASRILIEAARLAATGEDGSITKISEILEDILQKRPPGVPLAAVEHLRQRLPDLAPSSDRNRMALQAELRELSPLATVMSRTRKREVIANRPKREAKLIDVTLSPEEWLTYRRFSEQARREYARGESAGRNAGSIRFHATLIQQHLTSCIPAFLDQHLSRGRDRWTKARADFEGQFEPATEDDPLPDIESNTDDPAFTEAVRRIRSGRIDSKLESLIRTLKETWSSDPEARIVLFSFFKSTLAHLERRLKDRGIESLLISGDVPSRPDRPEEDERAKRVRRFHTDPNVRILLSSEVGAEGLDFQKASNIVIHYDLPWNPMRVEQRIGRIDRLGQPKGKIYSVSFALVGTLEERIRRTLHDRIDIFRSAIGDLEDIIGTELESIDDIAMRPHLSDEERIKQVEEIAETIAERQRLHDQVRQRGDELMGLDDAFEREIEAISRSGRGVSPEELADFVESTLESLGIRFAPVRTGQRRTSVADIGKLADFIRNQLPKHQHHRIALLSERNGLAIELNYADQESPHYITVTHPLALACVKARKTTHRGTADLAACIMLETDRVPQGTYHFGIAKLTDSGTIQPAYSIVTAVCDRSGMALPERESEILVQEAIVRGRDFRAAQSDSAETEGAIAAIETAIACARRERERRIGDDHGRRFQMRMDSLIGRARSDLRSWIARRETRDFRSKARRYQVMVDSRIDKLEANIKDLESKRAKPSTPKVGMSIFAMGIIEVAPCRP